MNNNHNLSNNNSSFSKFQINIVQNTPENVINYESNNDGNPSNIERSDSNKIPGIFSDMNGNKEYENETNDPNMVKIKFVVNKDEWKKKKRRILNNLLKL